MHLPIEPTSVPWLANLGGTIADKGVPRIFRWEDWPEPEDDAVLELSLRHQSLHDHLLEEAGERQAELLALWEQVQQATLAAAQHAILYNPQQDAWHAPTAAVWQAAWTAALVTLHHYTNRPLPADLADQWTWYLHGHWPCMYAWAAAGKVGPLVVF